MTLSLPIRQPQRQEDKGCTCHSKQLESSGYTEERIDVQSRKHNNKDKATRASPNRINKEVDNETYSSWERQAGKHRKETYQI